MYTEINRIENDEHVETGFTFELSKVLKFSRKGVHVETASLEFTPPGMAELKQIAFLNSALMHGALSAKAKNAASKEEIETAKKEKEDDSKVGIEEIKLMLFANSDPKFSFDKVGNAFKEIAYTTGTTDGKTAIRSAIFERMELNDFIDLVCEYCANFIFPSLF